MSKDLEKAIDISNTITDWILIGIWILQQVSQKRRSHMIADILIQRKRTDDLLAKLR